MNNERFNILLQRYLDRTASEDEVAEFMELLREPENEQRLSKLLHEDFKNEPGWFGDDKKLEARLQEVISKIEQRKTVLVRRRAWMAAASITAIIAMGVWYFPQFNKQTDNSVALNDSIVVITGKDYVRLPDGTRVNLNEESVLTYNRKSFGDTTREVTLKGEGYFDVGFDTKRPFKVWTGKIVTTVLGTAFHISVKKTDTASDKVTVTVSRGRVSVGDEQAVYDVLTPNQQIAVNTASKKFMKSIVDADTVSDWINDFFVLDNVTMAEAARLIGERFNVEVTIANAGIKECEIGAWFLNNEDLEHVLTVVSGIRQATFRMKDGKAVIEGGLSCKNE